MYSWAFSDAKQPTSRFYRSGTLSHLVLESSQTIFMFFGRVEVQLLSVCTIHIVSAKIVEMFQAPTRVAESTKSNFPERVFSALYLHQRQVTLLFSIFRAQFATEQQLNAKY